MIRGVWLMAHKDLRLILTRGNSLLQALLLGLLLVFLFSFTQSGAERISSEGAATIFWMASAFCQTLIFSTLFSLEENNGQRLGLLLSPVPVQAIWLGKALAGFLFLFLLQLVFLAATVVFAGQTPEGQVLPALATLLLADMGIAAAGSLLGAMAQGQATRESLCSIILFPLLLPLFLAGTHTLAAAFTTDNTADLTPWMGLAAAFDAIFIAAGLVLFPFIYGKSGS